MALESYSVLFRMTPTSGLRNIPEAAKGSNVVSEIKLGKPLARQVPCLLYYHNGLTKNFILFYLRGEGHTLLCSELTPAFCSGITPGGLSRSIGMTGN